MLPGKTYMSEYARFVAEKCEKLGAAGQTGAIQTHRAADLAKP